jgi:hypothetical protein
MSGAAVVEVRELAGVSTGIDAAAGVMTCSASPSTAPALHLPRSVLVQIFVARVPFATAHFNVGREACKKIPDLCLVVATKAEIADDLEVVMGQ